MKKRRRILWKKVGFYSFIFITMVALFYIAFRTPLFTITSYELLGVPQENESIIRSRLEEIAQKPLYKIFPSNRIFSYRKLYIKSLITEIVPTTETITLFPVGLHTLRITVTPYTPLFSIDDTHAITKDGVIYEVQKSKLDLPIFESASSTTKTFQREGVTVVILDDKTVELLSPIATLVEKIDSVLFPVFKITIDGFGDVKLFDKQEKSMVLIASSNDMKKVWSNLLSAIDTEPLKSKLVKDKNNLLYLDTRFGNKVFYKFTNIPKTDIIPSYVATTTSSTTISH